MSGFGRLFVLSLVILGIAAPAYAEGSLKKGEIVVSTTSGSGPLVARIGNDGATESITNVAGEALAIVDRNTIYVAGTNAENTAFDIWRVDVRSGDGTVAVSIPFSDYNWVYTNSFGSKYPTVMELLVDSSGRILLAVNGGVSGTYTHAGTSRDLLRFDPSEGPDPQIEVLDTGLAGGAFSYELGRDDTLYFASAQGQTGIFRFENEAFVPIAAPVLLPPNWGEFDIDRETGDLFFPSWVFAVPDVFFGVLRIEPDATFDTSTLIYDASDEDPSPVLWDLLELEHDGDVLWGTSAQGIRIIRIDVETGANVDVTDETLWPYNVTLTDMQAVHATCSNGLDDDGDDRADYRADGTGDLDCADADDDREVSYCNDDVDNDADGVTDAADSDCEDEQDEYDPRSDGEATECGDGINNDEVEYELNEPVEYIDFFDDECVSAWDDSETLEGCQGEPMSCAWQTQARMPACLDGWDNDGDGFLDWNGGPSGLVSDADPDCGGIPCVGNLDDCIRSELPACDDGIDNDQDGTVDYAGLGSTVDADPDCNEFTGTGELPDCWDGIDNDLDGMVDLGDSGCSSLNDNSELPECSDGIDNDGDGFIDSGSEPVPSGVGDNLVTNGGFEQGPEWGDPSFVQSDVLGDWMILPLGTTALDGWTVVEDSVDIVGVWVASEGERSLDLTGDAAGVIEQDITTTVGQTYVVSFDRAGNPGQSRNYKMRVSAAGQSQDFEFHSGPYDASNMGWRRDAFVFVATSTTTTVQFKSLVNGYYGPALDNVSVVGADPECSSAEDNREAPDPPKSCSTANLKDTSTSWLMVLLLLAMARVGRRARRRATKCVPVVALAIALGAPTGAFAQGSGQFTGLSTAPEANLFSGSMSTSVPILIPPGRKNMTPQLQLAYSSGGGSGVFGYGWSMPLGTVERSTKNGRPRCTGEHIRDFVLSLSGGQMELKDHGSINSSPKHRYRPRVDESSLEAHGDATPGQNKWTVFDRAGMTYRFGYKAESRAFHLADRFIFEDAHLDACEFTSIWALNEIEDPNGNTMLVNWYKHENTLYPHEIFYGGNAQAGLFEHPYKVVFKREARSTYGGVVIEQSHRGVKEEIHEIIDRVEVYFKPQTGSGYQLIRAYDLTYTASNGRLLLTGVDDDPGIAGDLLPPQTFTYATAPFNHDTVITYSHPEHSLGHTHSENGNSQTSRALMDVNGDGMTDLVIKKNGFWTVYPWERNAGPTNEGGISTTPFTWTDTGTIRREDNNGGSQGNPTLRKGSYDTLDLTGDGIVDWVDATSAPWKVYRGSCTGPRSCSFSPTYDSWSAPSENTSHSTKLGETWTTKKSLMDVNGDGRPDYVMDTCTYDEQSYNDCVFLNTGTAFDVLTPDATLFVQSESHSDQSSGVSTVKRAYMDFNGDGLPDELKSDGTDTMLLRLNTGRGYNDNAITLQTPGNNVVQSSYSPPGTDEGTSYSETRLDFFDVNADGLVDRVRKSDGSYGWPQDSWVVQLNQAGTDLGPEQLWHANLGEIGKDATILTIHNDGDVASSSTTKIALFDFNGDGFVDRVNAGPASWQIHLGKPVGDDDDQVKPLLLVRADNGIGGFTEVSYKPAVKFDHTTADQSPDYDLPFNNWLVTQIRRGDGISELMTQSFSYEGGLFDTTAREFRGFQTVTRTVDGNDTVTVYSQEDLTKGKALSVTQYVGAAASNVPLSRQTSVWRTTSALGRWQVYLAEQRIEEFSLTTAMDPFGQPLERCVLNRNKEPDDHGRVTRKCSLACASAPVLPMDGTQICETAAAGQVTTDTTWSTPHYTSSLRERPLTIETTYINAADQPETLAHKEFYYDGASANGLDHTDLSGNVREGNVKRVRTRFGAGENDWTTVLNQYDSYGNITQVTDPEGHSTSSAYSATSFHLYPVTETNALVHEVHTVTDLRHGKPTQKTGVNDEIAKVGYDGLGRVLCEAKPGETMPRPAGNPSGCDLTAPFTYSKQYRYHRGNPNAGDFGSKLSYVEVRSREPKAPNGHRESRQYVDGLGRKRVATTQQVVGAGPGLSTIVAEHVDYGVGGRVTDKFVPYVLAGPLMPDPGVDSTTFDYRLNGGVIDPKGRAHRVIAPNGEEAETYYEGRRTRVRTAQATPAHANEARSIEDHFGRVMRKETFEGNAGIPAAWFESTYDGMGRVLKETVAEHVSNPDASTLVTHTYDLLGREVALVDPDSGEWRFTYDKNGNVLSRDDPEQGQHVQWLYDALGRVTRVCTYTDDDYQNYRPGGFSCGAGGTTESAYIYDWNGNKGKGRLTLVVDQGGTESFVYDERGRITSQTRSIGGSSTALAESSAKTATMSFVYDTVDRVTYATYPGGQVVSYGYNAGGRPTSMMSGGGNYVNAIHYDLLGRPTEVRHGNGVTDKRSYYSADTENFRLKTIETVKGSNHYLDLEYAYNDLGKVATITDHRNGSTALSNTASYTYDPLGRLTVADLWGTAHDDAFSYNAIGNITQKGGQAMQYAGFPHQLTQYGTKSYEYNENGERDFEQSPQGNRAYTYDALGRLTNIALESGDSVEYVYDYSGRRTAKRVTEGGVVGAWARYFSDAVESEVDDQGQGWLIKYFHAGGQRIAMKREQNNDFVDPEMVASVPFHIPGWLWALLGLSAVVLLLDPGKREIRLGVAVGPARAMGGALLMLVVSGPAAIALTGCPPSQPTPQIQHYHVDHLGSTQVVTSPSGTIERQIRYQPYGEIRGRYDASGSELTSGEGTYRHEFTGYETELESGLQYAGARYYDPETAQFLSHDPERQYASPYAYGPGDPMNGTDPTGRDFGLTAFLVIAAIAALAAGVDAYIKTGSFKQAFKAAGMSLAMSVVTLGLFYGGGLVLQSVAPALAESVTAATAFKVGMAGYGAYGAVQSARAGNYASALVGAGLLVYSAYGISKGTGGKSAPKTVSGETDFGPELQGYLDEASARSIYGEGDSGPLEFAERPVDPTATDGGQAPGGSRSPTVPQAPTRPVSKPGVAIDGNIAIPLKVGPVTLKPGLEVHTDRFGRHVVDWSVHGEVEVYEWPKGDPQPTTNERVRAKQLARERRNQ